MDSYAVPALIRLMHHAERQAARRSRKQRRYASYQLDRMDRARPQKAITTAPDDRVRAEIIHAYGEDARARRRRGDPRPGRFVVAPGARARRAGPGCATSTGKPPPPAPKRKRKLPGGKEEAEEKPDYLTYREMAMLALQKQLAAIDDEPPDANAIGQADDRRAVRLLRQAARRPSGTRSSPRRRPRSSAAICRRATDEYGWILAHDPNYARAARWRTRSPRYADSLRDQGERPRALGYYRQAVDLDPDGPEARYAAARVALSTASSRSSAATPTPARSAARWRSTRRWSRRRRGWRAPSGWRRGGGWLGRRGAGGRAGDRLPLVAAVAQERAGVGAADYARETVARSPMPKARSMRATSATLLLEAAVRQRLLFVLEDVLKLAPAAFRRRACGRPGTAPCPRRRRAARTCGRTCASVSANARRSTRTSGRGAAKRSTIGGQLAPGLMLRAQRGDEVGELVRLLEHREDVLLLVALVIVLDELAHDGRGVPSASSGSDVPASSRRDASP